MKHSKVYISPRYIAGLGLHPPSLLKITVWTKILSRYQETVSLIVLNLYESLYTPILFWIKIFVIFNSRN